MRQEADATYIVAGNMAANITGAGVNTKEAKLVSFTCTFAGAPTGDLVIQGSNDDGATFADFSTTAVAAAGTLALSFEVGFQFMRAFYSFTAGTGTMEIQSGIKLEDTN